jgi:hypothetical protein
MTAAAAAAPSGLFVRAVQLVCIGSSITLMFSGV